MRNPFRRTNQLQIGCPRSLAVGDRGDPGLQLAGRIPRSSRIGPGKRPYRQEGLSVYARSPMHSPSRKIQFQLYDRQLAPTRWDIPERLALIAGEEVFATGDSSRPTDFPPGNRMNGYCRKDSSSATFHPACSNPPTPSF